MASSPLTPASLSFSSHRDVTAALKADAARAAQAAAAHSAELEHLLASERSSWAARSESTSRTIERLESDLAAARREAEELAPKARGASGAAVAEAAATAAWRDAQRAEERALARAAGLEAELKAVIARAEAARAEEAER